MARILFEADNGSTFFITRIDTNDLLALQDEFGDDEAVLREELTRRITWVLERKAEHIRKQIIKKWLPRLREAGTQANIPLDEKQLVNLLRNQPFYKRAYDEKQEAEAAWQADIEELKRNQGVGNGRA